MYPAFGGANQLWKWGPDDTLVSKMGLAAYVDSYPHELFQQDYYCYCTTPGSFHTLTWKYKNGAIKNTKLNLVMDVTIRENTGIAAAVSMGQENGNLGQKWTLVPQSRL